MDAPDNRIMIINGPNINLLGQREPEVYGHQTLADVEELCHEQAATLDMVVDFRQSNHEGEIVDWIHATCQGYNGLIINAGAYSHTSIAIADALRALIIPIIEVHLSNIFAREEYRHHSWVSAVAAGVLCGFGADGYLYALQAMRQYR